jgi:hypothetical protein
MTRVNRCHSVLGEYIPHSNGVRHSEATVGLTGGKQRGRA